MIFGGVSLEEQAAKPSGWFIICYRYYVWLLNVVGYYCFIFINSEKGKESTEYFPKYEVIIAQLRPTWLLSTVGLEMNWPVWVSFQRI